jgi:hypothetical protein
MFDLYDFVFFNYWFKKNYKGKISFTLSKRMTKSAGFTICPKNISEIKQEKLVIEIRIGVNLFFQYASLDGSKIVCGIKTNNSLEALQLVFEHELCHVIEFLNFHTSNCKGKRFKTISNTLFGHTESYHKLPTVRQIAREELGLRIGDVVAFDFKGKFIEGLIYNINKRATVIVKDKKGDFIDNKGNRYLKFYVSLDKLIKSVN